MHVRNSHQLADSCINKHSSHHWSHMNQELGLVNNITGPKSFYYLLNPPQEKVVVKRKEKNSIQGSGKNDRIKRLKKEMISLQLEIQKNRQEQHKRQIEIVEQAINSHQAPPPKERKQPRSPSCGRNCTWRCKRCNPPPTD